MIGLRRRPRKGPGLAPHIPMPDSATGTAAEVQPQFSDEDLKLIRHAVAATAGLSIRTLERGAALAAGLRARHGGSNDDATASRDALAALLPHLRFAEFARDQSGPTASWAHAISVLRAACHELNGGGDE